MILCQIAERNVNAFRQRTSNSCSVNVICTNILQYQLKGDESISFLYSPFDHPVTKGFLDLLCKSIDDNPRTLYLIIDEFRFPELLEDDKYFSHTGTYTYGAAEFQIYLHEAWHERASTATEIISRSAKPQFRRGLRPYRPAVD